MKSLKSPSSSFSNSQASEQTPQLAYRPFGGQTQKASFTPVTQTDVENKAFAEEKMEVTRLELMRYWMPLVRSLVVRSIKQSKGLKTPLLNLYL
ncbi:hypothetical protein [Nostoc sp. LPT]|uniref:hypothetical protein n=1 Tax=Nostoc sp. LPT TaxID=2815387 RepID=UPI001E0E0848|nr:hypothetical protein [Nostoc sp. LPT]MBN4004323.1 hypothetical protein [Nostoc sp. LPT]